MDDLFDSVGVFIGLILLGGLVGWVLGVVGFFRAGNALVEIERLRAELRAAERRAIAREVAPAPAPAPAVEAPPFEAPAAERVAEPPQESPVLEEAAAAAFVEEPAATEPATTESALPEPSVPEPPPYEPPHPARPQIDIETLLTQRWGVWLGAVALLFAGIFLIRYAIDQGLLGPSTRCSLAAILGLVLLGAGEVLRRRPPSRPLPLRDQTPAALAAGGVAVLFGAAYGFGPYYDLVPLGVGFALLAGAAMAGLALSLVQGPLVAAVGIVGAFVTPALVQTDDPSLPGLYAYLFAVTAASLGVVRYTAWVWLGWATTIAAGIWVLIGASVATGADAWAPALFVPAAAALNLALLPPAALETLVGRRLAWIPFAVLGVAGLLLCGSVDTDMPRFGVLLLAPIACWAGRQRPALDRLPWLAALLALAVLAIWDLPAWVPTGEPIIADGRVQAVLPGAWAPEAIRPLLSTSAVVALFFGAVGFWLERSAARPLRWAALPATVPVLVLALAYARVQQFQPDPIWALTGLVLSGLLVGAATLARREDAVQRAGIHAAGAVAALALGCGMILSDHWLSMTIALILPALAWIEERVDLPPLRHVALAVASVLLARLLLNWYVLDYAFGSFPIVNGLLAAYFVPAACFGFAARQFARRGNDLPVAVLQGGAVALLTAGVAAEIHHWATGGRLDADSTSFLEGGLHVDALGVLMLATLRSNRGIAAPVLRWAWSIQGAMAMAGAVLLLLLNPGFSDTVIGRLPLLDDLLAAYAVPVLLALVALKEPEMQPFAPLLRIFALVGGFVWLSLETRHLFHGSRIGFDEHRFSPAEVWCYSGVWLAYGAALMTAGIRQSARRLRLTALGMIGLVTLKVFLFDMGGLEGLWRVLSFLGLGLALIGLGAVYRRFVGAGEGPLKPAEAPEA